MRYAAFAIALLSAKAWTATDSVDHAAIAEALTGTAGNLVTVMTAGRGFALERSSGRMFTVRLGGYFCEFETEDSPPFIANLASAPRSSYSVGALEPSAGSAVHAMESVSEFDSCDAILACSAGYSCIAFARDSRIMRGPARIAFATKTVRAIAVAEFERVEEPALQTWLPAVLRMSSSIPAEMHHIEAMGVNGFVYTRGGVWYFQHTRAKTSRRLLAPDAVAKEFPDGSPQRQVFFRDSRTLPTNSELLDLFRSAAMTEQQWREVMRVSPAIAFMQN